MNKQLPLTLTLTASLAAIVCADELRQDLFMYPFETSSSNMQVSTSMHDFGSAPASYTLGGNNNSGSVSSTGATTSYASPSATEAAASLDQGGSRSTTSRSSGGAGASPSRPYDGTGASAPAGSVSGSGLAYGGAKDGKGVIPQPIPQPSPLIFTVEGGYQSQYTYNGLNRIRVSSYNTDLNDPSVFTDDDFDMWYAGVGVQWKGLSVGLTYIRSLDSDLNPFFHPSINKKSAYEEYVFDINYTLGLVAGPQMGSNWLDMTLGYEMTYFPEETFWNTDYQHKFYVELKMNRYKWARPSIAYHYIDQASPLTSPADTFLPGYEMLSGEQFIVQVDGGDSVYSNGSVNVGFGYYAKAGFGSGYETRIGALDVSNEDWYQVGVSMPIAYNNLVITPSVNYTTHGADPAPEEPGFWWGVNAKYTF